MVFQGNFERPAEVQWLDSPCLPPGMGKGLGGILTQAREAENDLLTLEAQLGERLLVPEVWHRVLEHAGILISSAICGGTFAQRVEEAQQISPNRCWLLLEPILHAFPLPCPTSSGVPLQGIPSDRPTFFSQDLLCHYAYDLSQKQMLLWDTRESLEEKIQLAKQAGFRGVVSAHTCPVLRDSLS